MQSHKEKVAVYQVYQITIFFTEACHAFHVCPDLTATAPLVHRKFWICQDQSHSGKSP